MLQLFSPDLFSDPVPRFAPVSQAEADVIGSVLIEAYGARVGPVERLRRSGAIEVNSKNFAVDARRGRFLLKRLDAGKDLAAASEQLALQRWLAEQGLPVPSVVPGAKGELIVFGSGASWCLFDFVEGEYFSGDEASLEPTARVIGSLMAACGRASALGIVATAGVEYPSPDDVGVLLRRASDRRADWADLFGVEEAALLEDEWEFVGVIAERLAAPHGPPRGEASRICHIDLHPHNLLLRGGRVVAVLDPDSYLRQPPQIALAFATYKLLRQHVVRHGLGRSPLVVAERGRAFVATIRAAADLPSQPGEIALAAKAEIFRRLLYILRSNVDAGDGTWNKVLPVHLAGLHEVDQIFAALA